MKISSEEVNKLRRDAREVVRELGLLNDAYFEIGVTLAERHLLIELSTSKTPTMKEIAEKLLLDKSTVSRLMAKALKKGFIECKADKNDGRKKLLKLTSKGKKTLHAFEPIAFNQTKKALLTLTPREVDLVYKGVSLYAKGLKQSRLALKPPPLTKIESLKEIHQELDRRGMIIRPFSEKYKADLFKIFKELIASGTLPFEEDQFKDFLSPKHHIYLCTSSKKVVGLFYFGENLSGRSNHIANAVYMVSPDFQGQGIGTLLIKASLQLAKEAGFKAMQFNRVYSQSPNVIRLYEKLGFNIIGITPEGIRNKDGSYQDGVIMYKKLEDL